MRRRATTGRRRASARRPGGGGARRPRSTARSTSRASKTSRGITQTGRAIVPATACSPRAQLEAGAAASSRRRRRRRRPRRSTSTHVRGDAVAAGLVAGEVGPVEQQHPQGRVGVQRRRARWPRRPGRRPRPRGPRSVPRLVGVLIGPTPAWPRRPAPCAIAARNGARPCATSATAASPAVSDERRPAATAGVDRGTDHDHHRGRDQHGGRDAPGPPRAEPVRQPADAGGRVVGQVGQHVDEVRADAEQRPGQRQPQRGQLGRAGRRARRRPGSAAERDGVRQPRPGRRLDPEVVGPAGGDADQVHQRRPPSRRPATAATVASTASAQAVADGALGDARRRRAACRGGRPRGRGRGRRGRWTSRSRAGRSAPRRPPARRVPAPSPTRTGEQAGEQRDRERRAGVGSADEPAHGARPGRRRRHVTGPGLAEGVVHDGIVAQRAAGEPVQFGAAGAGRPRRRTGGRRRRRPPRSRRRSTRAATSRSASSRVSST